MEAPQTESAALVQRQIDRSCRLHQAHHQTPEFKKWFRDTEIVLERIFGEKSRHISDFRGIAFRPTIVKVGTPYPLECQAGLNEARAILQSMIEELREFGVEQDPVRASPHQALVRIFDRFHVAARRLRKRRAGRAAVEIENEYNVQDLLHAFLLLEFEDIRPEECTPRYAGQSARTDLLLHDRKIAIEVKKTRRNLRDKEIGNELLVDIRRYAEHPSCTELYCFVYDPDELIENPRGLESDLARGTSIPVHVFIRPRHG